jgi:hypothetical protein
VPDTLTPEQARPSLEALLNHQIAIQGPPAPVEALQVSACIHQGPTLVCQVTLTFRGQAIARRAAFRPLHSDSSRYSAIWMPK